jgi:hypothetical protein
VKTFTYSSASSTAPELVVGARLEQARLRDRGLQGDIRRGLQPCVLRRVAVHRHQQDAAGRTTRRNSASHVLQRFAQVREDRDAVGGSKLASGNGSGGRSSTRCAPGKFEHQRTFSWSMSQPVRRSPMADMHRATRLQPTPQSRTLQSSRAGDR